MKLRLFLVILSAFFVGVFTEQVFTAPETMTLLSWIGFILCAIAVVGNLPSLLENLQETA